MSLNWCIDFTCVIHVCFSVKLLDLLKLKTFCCKSILRAEWYYLQVIPLDVTPDVQKQIISELEILFQVKLYCTLFYYSNLFDCSMLIIVLFNCYFFQCSSPFIIEFYGAFFVENRYGILSVKLNASLSSLFTLYGVFQRLFNWSALKKNTNQQRLKEILDWDIYFTSLFTVNSSM